MKKTILIFAVLCIAVNINAQIKFNRNIPNEAHTKISQLLPKRISSFSFSPNGGWVIVTKSNETFARNIPNECYKKIAELKKRGHKIKQVSFPPKGGSNSWIIVTNKTTFARNIPKECNAKIQEFKKKGKRIKSVSFPYKNIYNNSNNAWAIITTDGNFYARNIPDECYQIMQNLKESDMPNKKAARKIHQVSFAPNGGFAILADDYFFARNIPSEAYNKLKSFRKKKYKSSNIVFTPNGKGWSLIANDKYSRSPKDLIRKFESNVDGKSIWQAMRDVNANGVSVGMVINGKLAWTTAYGHLRKGDKKYAVHPESMFQAASISKVFAAIGAYKMTEKNLIKMNDNVQNSLKKRIPIHSCFNNYNSRNRITLLNILNHSSGIDGSNAASFGSNCPDVQGGGYPGYLNSIALRNLPDIKDIISGSGNANSDPVTVTHNGSNSNTRYSGPAFSVLQQLTEDLTNQKYASWMKYNILNPMKMTKSAFTVNPERNYKKDELTWGNVRGRNVRNRYPEFAAAGLYTNVKELSNLVIMLNDQGKLRNTQVINSKNADLLIRGNGTNNSDENLKTKNSFYAHGGSNQGYKAFFIGFPNLNKNIDGIRVRDAGIVVLTSGDIRKLRYDITTAIINAYRLN